MFYGIPIDRSVNRRFPLRRPSSILPHNNPTHADIVAEALEGGFIKPQ
ncbi:MAG: hypothetical protein KGQ87_10580 [Verrucomicrobia bacterium]|nr:hypothetical protein [Verrucomicrobiota bacterium]